MLYVFSSKPKTIINFLNERDIVFELVNKDNYAVFLHEYTPKVGDLGIVYDFGKMIPESLLQNLLLINVHFSLLPRYRGAVPVEAAILAGDRVTGITFQKMVKDMDAGDILLQESIQIEDTWSAEELQTYMDSQLPTMLEKFFEISQENFEFVPQKGEPTYCYMKWLNRENAEIDFFTMTSEEILRKVRAFNPEPIAWTKVLRNGKLLEMNILNVELSSITDLAPKQLSYVRKMGVYVGCKTGAILLKSIVIAGSKTLENGDIVALKGSLELA